MKLMPNHPSLFLVLLVILPRKRLFQRCLISIDSFQAVDEAIAKHEICTNTTEGIARRLFYLALPPSMETLLAI
ncbi:hypothetical protein Leryth_011967 [Lithospermum erythrorhizon]|nr:hypothetical protein Leryth_011967 [Lithospermum erythrorhizon]